MSGFGRALNSSCNRSTSCCWKGSRMPVKQRDRATRDCVMSGGDRTMLGVDTHRLLERLSAVTPFRTVGTVRSARGLVLSCRLPAAVGDQCEILSAGRPALLGEVIGFSEQ